MIAVSTGADLSIHTLDTVAGDTITFVGTIGAIGNIGAIGTIGPTCK